MTDYNFNDIYLSNLLEMNGFEVSDRNIDILKETLGVTTFLMDASNLSLCEDMAEDYIYMQLLDNNGFKVTNNNIRVLKEAIDNGHILLEEKGKKTGKKPEEPKTDEKPEEPKTDEKKDKKGKAKNVLKNIAKGAAVAGTVYTVLKGANHIQNAVDKQSELASKVDAYNADKIQAYDAKETANKALSDSKNRYDQASQNVTNIRNDDSKTVGELKKAEQAQSQAKTDHENATRDANTATKAYNVAETNSAKATKAANTLNQTKTAVDRATKTAIGLGAGGTAAGLLFRNKSKSKDDQDKENDKKN